MASIIGKLVGVPLGEVWGWKAADFTGWLLQKENLGLLASELRFQLELGSYRRLVRAEGNR